MRGAAARSEGSTSLRFDYQRLWDRVCGDRQLLRELLDLFVQEYPGLLSRIQHAVQHGAAGELQRSSHELKGALLQFSAGRAASLAASLEDMGRLGSLNGAKEALAGLQAEMPLLMDGLHSWIRAHSAPDRSVQ
jgi:HPt (histidine-containing phosphotransfer) domain-containing protein